MIRNAEILKRFLDSLAPETLIDVRVPPNDAIFGREWYCGTKNRTLSAERVRDQRSSRFAISGRKVCYLAVDCARIDFEIGDFFAEKKQEKEELNFARDLWPRMTGHAASIERTQHILGAFKLKSDLKIFNLGNEGKIQELNELWNRFVEDAAQKDFITWMIEGPRPDVYAPSGLFADAIYNRQFDGILYKPTTIIQNILGPCNDPMLVLFEPACGRVLTGQPEVC